MLPLQKIIVILCAGKRLPKKYRPHILTGSQWNGAYECHVTNEDWLLIYNPRFHKMVQFINMGKHDELFA